MHKMNFYVEADPRYMEHFSASYVTGRVVDHPSVKLSLPAQMKRNVLGNDLTAREIMNTTSLKKLVDVEFQIEGKPYHVDGVISPVKPYTGNQIEIIFGPYNPDLIQTAHDDLKRFLGEAEKRLLPLDDKHHGEHNPHFHVTIVPNVEIFKGPENIKPEEIEGTLLRLGLKRTGQIARYEVCGCDGYEGKICGLDRDGVVVGVLEWTHGERSGVWDDYGLYSLR
jgi:hypothetical protein